MWTFAWSTPANGFVGCHNDSWERAVAWKEVCTDGGYPADTGSGTVSDTDCSGTPPNPCVENRIGTISGVDPTAGLTSWCVSGCTAVAYGPVMDIDANGLGTIVARFTGAICNPDTHGEGPPPNDEDHCETDANGNEICGNGANDDCGTFNGVEVCAGQGGCGYINGVFVCPEHTDNCTTQNGKTVCAENPQDPDGPPAGCIADAFGNMVCLDNQVETETTETTTTTTDQNGVTTTTTTTTTNNNVQGGGSSTSTTTTTDDGNGNVTTVTEESGEPEQMPGLPQPADYQGFDDHISGIGGWDPGIASWSTSGWTVPEGGACSTVSFTIKGETLTIPSAEACSMLAKIRAIVAFFLYLGTAYLLYDIATRRAS